MKMTPLPAKRLIPLLIVTSFAMLGLRGYDFWQGWTDPDHYGWGNPALAEEHPPAAAPPAEAAHPAAAAPPAAAPAPHAPSPAEAAAPVPEAAASKPMQTEFTPDEVHVLQNLAQRREELDKRALEMNQHEALLTAAEQRIDGKIKELETLRGELQGLLQQVDGQEEERIASLVKIYETMKPREAAAILEGLEMSVALVVLERMREAKSAPILAAMDPQKASKIITRSGIQGVRPRGSMFNASAATRLTARNTGLAGISSNWPRGMIICAPSLSCPFCRTFLSAQVRTESRRGASR